jgi:hypothetical protein
MLTLLLEVVLGTVLVLATLFGANGWWVFAAVVLLVAAMYGTRRAGASRLRRL